MNFDHKHYVPLLRGKMGEFIALKELTQPVRSKLTPLLEIPERDWDYDLEEYKKTIEEHINRFPDLISGNWGLDQIFIDGPSISETDKMNDDSHPLDYIFRQLSSAGSAAIPVTSLSRPKNYQQAVKAIIARDGRGLCIKIEQETLSSAIFNSDLKNLLENFNLAENQVDLVLDLGFIGGDNQVPIFQSLATNFISTNSFALNSRTLTLLSSAFPVNLSNFGIGISSTPRSDWQLWQNIIATPQLPRLPSFGDYAISNPEVSQIDPRLMRMSASIRYTSQNEWFIFRGYGITNAQRGGASQYFDLARKITKHPSWCGSHFSWGDTFIDNVAKELSGPGNGQSWRQAPTNHHLHFVIDQIANLP